MTYDELLTKIPAYESALLAVVELHKPQKTAANNGSMDRKFIFACRQCMKKNTHSGMNYVAYPCPTIQAIEKELI
jgi:hypothetical protein